MYRGENIHVFITPPQKKINHKGPDRHTPAHKLHPHDKKVRPCRRRTRWRQRTPLLSRCWLIFRLLRLREPARQGKSSIHFCPCCMFLLSSTQLKLLAFARGSTENTPPINPLRRPIAGMQPHACGRRTASPPTGHGWRL